jgi:hypothetical protein
LKPRFLFVLSLGTAAALAMMLYLASTSLPYLATSPTTDPNFGVLNQCLMTALGEPRVGFAVAADGTRAMTYGNEAIALCAQTADGGIAPPRVQPLTGVTGATFDHLGTLWLATQEGALWRLGPADEKATSVGDFAPIALAGHAQGVAGVDASGRVVSLVPSGAVLGVAQLPAPPTAGAAVASNVDGSLVAVTAGTGLFVYRTKDLSLVRAEGPCDVEFLWWLPQPGQALVACGPSASWALILDVESGRHEAAPGGERVRSSLVPGLKNYVQACEHLPCTAPSP